ncbi:putative thiol methyltransferase protein [Daldinia childiae]|uniref:putative thiol methyltransferase protein n=1 Tax=Daldinia childiae TaxID=326645 RepID=UPI0014471FE4|nr:putative thiol methyltransferase protein [Daldinia childiae]KAF3058520.1 putative thiol methyltransferase protein [Daldinia childiae]
MNAPITSPTMAQRQLPSTTAVTGTMTQGFAPPPPPVQKTPGTDAFIQNLNLVAEAAKRAQMAVLMRDLEGIAIS